MNLTHDRLRKWELGTIDGKIELDLLLSDHDTYFLSDMVAELSDQPLSHRYIVNQNKTLGITQLGKHCVGHNRSSLEQWRFVDAREYSDYPDGYWDSEDDGQHNGVIGSSKFQSGTYYVIDDTRGFFLGVSPGVSDLHHYCLI